MKKLKIVVYAITKNEEKFVDRWVDSMSEADEIYVLDTGSTDKTVKLLKKRGVNVFVKKFKNWRFDVARNESLNLVPEDVDLCVCTDLDEVFEFGWRKKLEENYNGSTRVRYNYNWSLDEFNKPLVNFYLDKIHVRNGYKWTHPVHEVLMPINIEEKYLTIEDITLNHYPDSTKSRGSYLPLLELSVKEDPFDDRNMHYLGREYMYYGKWNECIDTLIKHLNLESATWKDERSASMRFIARSYKNLGRNKEAEMWYKRAHKEAEYLREPLVELAILYNDEGKWEKAIEYLIKAKKISNKYKSYINEVFAWDTTIDDLLSIAYFNLGLKYEALFYINKVIEEKPNDERILMNKELMEM